MILPEHIFKQENNAHILGHTTEQLWTKEGPKPFWRLVGHTKHLNKIHCKTIKQDHDIAIMLEHIHEGTRLWISKTKNKEEQTYFDDLETNDITKNIAEIYSKLNCITLINSPDSQIVSAYYYAQDKHKNILRKYSNKPYFDDHLITVAKLVSQNYTKYIPPSVENYNHKPHVTRQDAIAAALLHDVLEDTPTTETDLKQEFGPTITNLVKALTRNQNQTYTQFICTIGNSGPGPILIKLMDLHHNKLDLQKGPQKDKYELATLYLWDKLKKSIETYNTWNTRDQLHNIQYNRTI